MYIHCFLVGLVLIMIIPWAIIVFRNSVSGNPTERLFKNMFTEPRAQYKIVPLLTIKDIEIADALKVAEALIGRRFCRPWN